MKATIVGPTVIAAALVACQGKSTADSADATGDAPQQAAAAEPSADAKAEAKAEAKASPPAGLSTGDDLPPPAPPLTQEEKDLIAADPATLTPEKRRLRAFALRKKIMQNPDSPTARMLEDLRKAAERGELNIPGKTTPRLSAPGVEPSPPAGTQKDTKKIYK